MSSIQSKVIDGHAAEAKQEKASSGFPPVAGPEARILILGSLPGQRSIEAQQYYAHPRNAFWPIMAELVGARGAYSDRCRQLAECRIALWDVLESSVRPGSLDASIRLLTAQRNDFERFFAVHAGIDRIGFNGRKAAQLFSRLVATDIDCSALEQVILPSTSPAFAAMPLAGKLDRWRAFLRGEAPGAG